MVKLFPFQGVPSLAPSGPQLAPSGPRSQRFHRWSPLGVPAFLQTIFT